MEESKTTLELAPAESEVPLTDYELYIHRTFLPSLKELIWNENRLQENSNPLTTKDADKNPKSENFSNGADLKLVCKNKDVFYSSRLLMAAVSPILKENLTDSEVDTIVLPENFTYENLVTFHELLLGSNDNTNKQQQSLELLDSLGVDYLPKIQTKKKSATKIVLTCPECDKEYVNEASFKNHVFSHAKELKKSPLKEISSENYSSNDSRPKRRCIKPLKYSESAELEVLQEDFKESVQKRKKVTNCLCEICNKSFSSKLTLENHMKIHNDERTYECDACDKKFVCDSHLRNHKKTHETDQNSVKCPHCEKTVANLGNLQRHIRSAHFEHSDMKQFACETCGKLFRDPSALKSHAKIHTGERPFTCDACSKSFQTRAQLKIHTVS